MFMAWEWAHPSIATVSAKAHNKQQAVEEAKTLLLKIGMVWWVYCFVENPDPADNEAISNAESALFDSESRELFLNKSLRSYKPVLSLMGSAHTFREALEGINILVDLRATHPTISPF